MRDLTTLPHIARTLYFRQVVVTKVERLDNDYLNAVGMTLESEWLSNADEEAYADL